MDKLKINLIPPEIKAKVKKQAKRSLITRISIGLLGLLIIFTSLILAGVIFQKAALQSLDSEIEKEKQQVGTYKDKEAVVTFLKNRIDTINQYANTQYHQGEIFELITKLFPSGVRLSGLQVDKNPVALLQGETEDTASLDQFFSNLTDPKTNEGKIASVSVESLNKSANGKIRFDLHITIGGGK